MTSAEINEKINKGELDSRSERIDLPKPNGGDYSEIFYFNENGEPVNKDSAVCATIRECKEDGEVVHDVFVDFRES